MLRKLQFSRIGLTHIVSAGQPRARKVALSGPSAVCIAIAAATLIWVGWLTWVDMSVWGKDLGSIFFGSRAGEPISLGIGMTVLHYFLIGMIFLSSGIILFLRNHIAAKRTEQAMWANAPTMQKPTVSMAAEANSSGNEENVVAREERFFSGCLHHFGYLSARPKDSPIPQECILCQRLGDCMVATIYVEKSNE